MITQIFIHQISYLFPKGPYVKRFHESGNIVNTETLNQNTCFVMTNYRGIKIIKMNILNFKFVFMTEIIILID